MFTTQALIGTNNNVRTNKRH